MDHREYLDIEFERLKWMREGCIEALAASEKYRGAEVQAVESNGSVVYYVKMPGREKFRPVGGPESPEITMIMVAQAWLDLFMKTEQDLNRIGLLRESKGRPAFGKKAHIPARDYKPPETENLHVGAGGSHEWNGDEPPVPLKEETDRRLYRGADFRSRSGTAVRSPAEAQLADEFDAWGIPYLYEFHHYIGENVLIPEFTIYSDKHDREIVWLHCDDVSNEKSRLELCRRQVYYAINGFTPSWDMMVSYGDRKGNLKLEPARLQLGFWFDSPVVKKDLS